MRTQWTAATLVSLLALSACTTSHRQYRKLQPPIPPIVVSDLETRQDVSDGNGASGCSELLFRDRSIEKFKAANGEIFTIGVIELSDDGHLKNIGQRDMVFRELKRVARGGEAASSASPGVVLVTFVHGWHHRAKVCDENLSCFRRTMEGLVLNKSARTNPGPVFGIFIGWRGESARGHAAPFTFYNRKATAQRVGSLGGSEVLLELNQIQKSLDNEVRTATGGERYINMVTVGHSFGGALVYSAVESLKVAEYGENEDHSAKHGVGFPSSVCQGVKPVREGIGDLVILVNPAFEARRYRYFAEDLKEAGSYSEAQRPVLLTVASTADQAVGTAFPAGRFLWLLWHPAAWNRARQELIGLGHYAPYITHHLIFNGPGIEPPKAKPLKDQEAIDRCKLEDELKQGLVRETCGCSYPVFAQASAAVASGATSAGSSDNPAQLKEGAGSVHVLQNQEVTLQPVSANWDKHTPFIVASAPGNLIANHNDIYNPNFVMFLIGYINSSLSGPGPAKPPSEGIPQCQ